MPDYRLLPPQGSITIEDALHAGKLDITCKSRAILIAGIIFSVLLPVCGLSILLLPAGIVAAVILAFVYTIWITPRWRIWAYSGVADIHQFQRCAELELLLPKQSPMLVTGIMNAGQRALLAQLQQRFSEDAPFIDDPDVQEVSYIYGTVLSLSDLAKPIITINRLGIQTKRYGFFSWKDISNEHVGTKSFSNSFNTLAGYGLQNSSTADYFCFTCPDLQVEIPMNELSVSSGELDQMLYVHRGRYDQFQEENHDNSAETNDGLES